MKKIKILSCFFVFIFPLKLVAIDYTIKEYYSNKEMILKNFNKNSTVLDLKNKINKHFQKKIKAPGNFKSLQESLAFLGNNYEKISSTVDPSHPIIIMLEPDRKKINYSLEDQIKNMKALSHQLHIQATRLRFKNPGNFDPQQIGSPEFDLFIKKSTQQLFPTLINIIKKSEKQSYNLNNTVNILNYFFQSLHNFGIKLSNNKYSIKSTAIMMPVVMKNSSSEKNKKTIKKVLEIMQQIIEPNIDKIKKETFFQIMTETIHNLEV